jgi:polysaccharide export outer membrane protein
MRMLNICFLTCYTLFKQGGVFMKLVKSCVWRKHLLRLMMLGTFFHFFGLFVICYADSGNKQAPPLVEKEYLIGIGDVLEISVWHEPDISKVVFVRLDGRISLPLVGDVFAQGLSPEALSQIISKNAGKFIADPSVTVTLKESKSRMYYVLGQITRPGEYSLNYPVSIVQAIARAGGFAEWAKKEKVIVVRKQDGKETIIHFNYDKFIDGKDLGMNLSLNPGDTLIVP